MTSHTDTALLPGGASTERDAQVLGAALHQLRSSGYLLLRRLDCKVTAGVVTVSGAVPTYHLKQVAQAILMRVASVREVHNVVEVR
jgi:osmotically-inducible protein OsmY